MALEPLELIRLTALHIRYLRTFVGEPQQDLYGGDNGDELNAWLCAQRRGEPWALTWHDFRTNRQLLQQRLQAISEATFLQTQPAAPFPSVYHCAWSALEHYLDHAAGLRRELQLPLPVELLSFHGPYTD